MAGRKTKLTPQLIEEAAKFVAAGNYHRHVAQFFGISPRTWYRWLQEGEKARKGLKRKFYEEITKAEAHAILRSVWRIQQAANENWQAAAWWLERRYPDEWGRKDRLDMRTEGGIVIRIQEIGTNGSPSGENN